jgi:hypothetical protein
VVNERAKRRSGAEVKHGIRNSSGGWRIEAGEQREGFCERITSLPAPAAIDNRRARLCTSAQRLYPEGVSAISDLALTLSPKGFQPLAGGKRSLTVGNQLQSEAKNPKKSPDPFLSHRMQFAMFISNLRNAGDDLARRDWHRGQVPRV